MNGDTKTYELPTHSLPSLDISVHIKDLQEIIYFLEGRGISAKNTRLYRYLSYLKERSSSSSFDESNIFKNSLDGPFKSSGDWYLYTLREVHELMWILKGLKKHIPKGVDEKLELIVSGRDFAALDIKSLSRDTQFELRIASYFCQAGCYVDLSSKTDIIATNPKYAFYIECKRVGSPKQLESRLLYASHQLNERMPHRVLGRITAGCIAADVTKVGFQHNGLTFAMTNEHSRDVIQEKLINIASSTKSLSLFNNCQNLNQLWLQIHMPSQIVYPLTSVTRFSSYFIFRDNANIKQKKAIKTFKMMFEACSKDDERGSEPKRLKRKNGITVPKGSTFFIDEDLLVQYLSTGLLPNKGSHDKVAKIAINGKKDEFSFIEFQTLTATISDDERRGMAENIDSARLYLVLDLYLQRYPYEEA